MITVQAWTGLDWTGPVHGWNCFSLSRASNTQRWTLDALIFSLSILMEAYLYIMVILLP